MFAVGDQVRVRRGDGFGHVRTPGYIQGKTGVVERVCNAFRNPEERAWGRDGLPARRLYRVRFQQSDVWADYTGNTNDTLDMELYEHWLTNARA